MTKDDPAAIATEGRGPRRPGTLDLETVATFPGVSVPVTFYCLTELKPRF